jgi:hypothetical protein
MTGSFEERENAFESKWAHDEELRFRVITRRNKLLALWAAGEMGLDAKAAQDYVRDVLDVEVRSGKDEDVVQKIHGDFEARKIPRTEHLIRLKMDELLAAAKEQVMHETKA